MNFIEKILNGIQLVIDFLAELFAPLFNLIGKGFNALLDFLEKPLSLLFHFLDGIFYFITKIYDVVVMVIKIFVALFQFLGALITGLFRTIRMWLVPNLSDSTSFPSVSNQGFDVVMDLLQPTGLLTVVPAVAIGFVWIFFVLRVISLFGGSVNFDGRFGGDKGSSDKRIW